MSYDKKLLDINIGEVAYWYPYDVSAGWKSIELIVAGKIMNFRLTNEIYGELLTLHKLGYYEILIINDSDFAALSAEIEWEDKATYTGVIIENWKKSYDVSMKIKNELEESESTEFYSKSILYKGERKDFGLVLFIGFFIAFLFCIASGSIIYFKLFNEIKQDGLEYDILRKIGATQKEINKIATKQIGIIFFLPFVVGTSHAFFALKSLSNLFKTNLFVNGVIVILGYLVFQLERPYDWYVYQLDTGEYGYNNCMPASIEMAMRYQALSEIPSAEKLRADNVMDGMGWYDQLAEDVMIQYGLQFTDSWDINLDTMVKYLDEGNILYVMYWNPNLEIGHASLIKGYWKKGDGTEFIISDPDHNLYGPFGYQERIVDAETMIYNMETHVPRYFVIPPANN